MFPLLTDCQAPGSKTTPFGIGPIPQASPYLEWGPGASSLAPNRTGPHSCSTNPGYQGLPQEWGPGPMPPRSWIPAPSPTSAPSSPPKSHLPPGEGTLTSQKPRLWSPSPGAAGGEGGSGSGLLRRGFAPGAGAGRRRSGVLSRAPGGPEHAPSSAPGRGTGARRALSWPGQRADLSSSRGTRSGAALQEPRV